MKQMKLVTRYRVVEVTGTEKFVEGILSSYDDVYVSIGAGGDNILTSGTLPEGLSLKDWEDYKTRHFLRKHSK